MANAEILMIEDRLHSDELERLLEHHRRVRDLSVRLTKRLGLLLEINDIEVAALHHDVGKLLISSEIINKSEKLTMEEIEVIKKHSIYSSRVMKCIGASDKICSYIKYHHERWDGQGYPDGLIGEEIPLGSRIIAICDAFDAMTNDRIYRKKFTFIEAISEMDKSIGQFDPKVYNVFRKMMGY